MSAADVTRTQVGIVGAGRHLVAAERPQEIGQLVLEHLTSEAPV